MNRKIKFTVEVELPPGTTAKDVASFLKEEAFVNIGMLETSDPLFYLDRKTVKVGIYNEDKFKPETEVIHLKVGKDLLPACGNSGSRIGTYEARDVTCGRCKRTKIYKEKIS